MSRLFRKLLFVAFLCMCITSCVDALKTEVIKAKNYLVVEGFISTGEGPHEVLITRMTDFTSRINGGAIERTHDASVFVIDQNNNKTELIPQVERRKELETNPFVPCLVDRVVYVAGTTPYRTPPGFRAKIGDTYTLEIRLKEGKIYRSTPQQVPQGPAIDSLTLKYKRLPSLSKSKFRKGIEVVSNWKDPAGERNFYSWRINGIYKIETPDTGQCCLFDPNDGGDELCWIYENNLDGIKLAYTDTNTDGNKISQAIGFIEDNGYRFSSSSIPNDRLYYMEVEQMSVSEEAYLFYVGLETLISIDGDIFDPPPLNIKGNIKNIEDPGEEVLGFFGAYSVTKKSIFITKDLFEDPITINHPCGDCRIRTGAVEISKIPEPFR